MSREDHDHDAPLDERERLLMAYVDDELDAEERARFERAMAEDPALAEEVAAFRSLLDLSRSMPLAEPTDQEVRRFWARFYNRTEWRLGWILLLGGLAVLVADGVYVVVTTGELDVVQKAGILAALAGTALLLWNTVRLRLRTSRFDRYRGVMR